MYQRLHDNKQRLTEYVVKLTEVYRGMEKCNDGIGKLKDAKRLYESALKHSYPTQQSQEERITIHQEVTLNSLTGNGSPVEKAMILFEKPKL